MKNIIILALSLISGIILNSCSSIDMFLHPSEYEKKATNIPSPMTAIYVYDTVYIKNNDGEVISGVRPGRQLKFSTIGQEHTFKNGESIEVILDSIDMNTMTLDMVTDEASKEITLKLIHKDSVKVILTKRCQTVNRYNTNYIPKVEVDCKELEQVVTTPICDEKCNVIGYQIRYGARERGCKNPETDSIYKRYKDCQDNGKVDGTAVQGGGIDPKCQKLQKMGLPCN